MIQRLQGVAVGFVFVLIFVVSVLSGGNSKDENIDVIQPIPFGGEMDADFAERLKKLIEEMDEDCDCEG